jgi:diaminohydroxyphosphoribosylaminopyrimidine deaminase/5-amino-6-(5-phosphoribosylamino)uracil reductase
VASQREIDAMRLAIVLSARGLGTTSPNPPVGCVILDARGEVVGTGYHERKGEPHAEAHALAAAGERARGGTAVVTLEPCNHAGRTPACRQALLDAGVTRVVIALMDPTSRGEGGAAVLRAAGVGVEVGVLADEARLVLGDWLTTFHTRRPIVTWAYPIGGRAIDGANVDELRASIDVVVHADGRIEEAVAGSHGNGILSLPEDPVSEDAHHAMKALFEGGARSALLLGPSPLGDAWLAAGVVDRILMYGSTAGPAPEWGGPDGFILTGITRTDGYVRVELARSNLP